jgi:SecD/SecF fusion protein
MKTIIYSIIAIFIIGIFATGFTYKSNNTYKILIQSTESKISLIELSKSAEIITNRLKSFSSEKFILTTFPDKNQIQVILDNQWDLKTFENLITQKGTLEFYETYNYKNLVELLKGDDKLMSLMHAKAPGDSSAKIGCTSFSEISKVNEYLNSIGLSQKCKFMWSNFFENSNICLYALRLENGEGVIVRGKDIENFTWKVTTGNHEWIEFHFKKSAIKLWSELTKRNINKSIAVVLDNQVIFAPVMRSEIDGGHCLITGDFNQTQMKYIAAIGGNDELPVNFYVVK